jgi:hypothetical protein
MNLTSTYNKTQMIGQSGSYSSDCIAIQFYIPSGANPAYINGLLIPAGSTYQIGLDHPYIDRTNYEINFGSGGSGNEMYITRTFVMGGER